MNRKLKKLLCSLLLLTLSMAAFAKDKDKSERNSTCRPLFTALELNVGGAAWVEKPLSYFTFDGPGFSVGLELMRAAKAVPNGCSNTSFAICITRGRLQYPVKVTQKPTLEIIPSV